MMAVIRRLLGIKTKEEAIAETRKEPAVKKALLGLQRVDRILVELEGLEGKKR